MNLIRQSRSSIKAEHFQPSLLAERQLRANNGRCQNILNKVTQHVRRPNRLHRFINIRSNFLNRLTLNRVNQTFKEVINIPDQGLRYPPVINGAMLLGRQGRTIFNSNRRDSNITIRFLSGVTFGQTSLVQFMQSVVSVRVVHLRSLPTKGLLSQEEAPQIGLTMNFITRVPSWRGQGVGL